MTLLRLTPDEPAAWSRAVRPFVRQWLSSWSGSVLLHGTVVCCFAAVAQSGPQSWPVVRGRASAASAPVIDSRAGSLAARMSEMRESLKIDARSAIESLPPLPAESSATRAALRWLQESVAAPAKVDPDDLVERELAKIRQQLERASATQFASQQFVTSWLSSASNMESLKAAERAERVIESDHKTVNDGDAARMGNAESDSAAAAPSTASQGADSDELPRQLATNAAPLYPEAARAAGLQGTVLLRLRIGADGGVESVKLLRSSGVASLDESALSTVRGWRFEPARHFGRPIAMDVKHAVVFKIEEHAPSPVPGAR